MSDRDASFKITVGKEIFNFTIQGELGIDRHDLDKDIIKQSALYAYFGDKHERLRYERVRLEAELDEMESRVYLEVLGNSNPAAGKKPTEAAIKAKVRLDPRVVDLIRRVQDVEADERKLGVFVSAFSQRKDMLQLLCKNKQLEMTAPTAAEVDRIKSHLLGR